MKDLYLRCNILLLAEVFEKIRNNSLKNYGLCPSHYLSATGLSWDAMLKMTKNELELSPYPDPYSLRNVQKMEFLMFLIDIAKPTINI